VSRILARMSYCKPTFNCCYLETCNKARADSWILSMYFSKILMCVNILPYVLGKYYQLHTTNTTQIFIHKFIEKGNSQQFKNL
jgi:hypothetical protein